MVTMVLSDKGIQLRPQLTGEQVKGKGYYGSIDYSGGKASPKASVL
jgi:hypothetical protein